MMQEERRPYREEKEQIKLLTDYFRSGFKKPEDRLLGVEVEYFLTREDTMERVFYEGDPGVKQVLEDLVAQGYEPVRPEGALIGAVGKDCAISIEPGAQFELSVSPQPTVETLCKTLWKCLQEIDSMVRKRGLCMVAIGIDPLNEMDKVPMIPKDRYRIMNEKMSKKAGHTKAMMRLSCALQISMDVESEEDFIRKYRVLTALSPILYTLFDSAPYFQGEKVKNFNLRQQVWRDTDSDRCGLIPGTFDADFGLEAYAKWLLTVPVLFLPDAQGQDHETEETLGQALARAESEEEARRWMEHGISIVFPDIRMKKLLEIRQMDEVPPELTFGAIALLKGLLYDAEVLNRLSACFREISLDIVERGKDSGRDHGIQGYYFSDYFAHWGLRLLDLAKEGLDREEAKYLEPLERLWSQLDTPRICLERAIEEQGWEEGLRTRIVNR